MKRCVLLFSSARLAELLDVPGAKLVDVSLDHYTGSVEVILDHDGFPELPKRGQAQVISVGNARERMGLDE